LLIDLKEAEFKKGDRPSGKPLGKYRSKTYAALKQRMNPLAHGDVDLILTGSFINSAFITKPTEGTYLFGFRDSKTNSLIERYGTDIKGLNQETFNGFQNNVIKPVLVEKIKARLK
jgi:hypothetical protein